MTDILFLSDPALAAAVFAVAIVAGIVKGVVGFAMPMILLSGVSSLISPEIALSALIVPTLLTNGWQALRQGFYAAFGSVRKYWRFLCAGGVFMVVFAQIVPLIEPTILLFVLGVLISGFAAMQLWGWQPKIDRPTPLSEMLVGSLAGLIGGLSGIWGPPTVTYLTAMNTDKKDQVRIQGVIYGLGAVVLLIAHTVSGVFNRETAPLSFVLVVPAMLGLFIGFAIHDRIDQQAFKRATLVVLFVAGLNLLRRGLIG